MFEAKVQCKRCGQVWMVQQGMTDAECNCHQWCDRGRKPSDCNLTVIDTQTVEWGYPANMDVKSANEGEDIIHRKAYCNTHKIYSYREPIVMEVDWNKWRNTRKIPASMKEIQNR